MKRHHVNRIFMFSIIVGMLLMVGFWICYPEAKNEPRVVEVEAAISGQAYPLPLRTATSPRVFVLRWLWLFSAGPEGIKALCEKPIHRHIVFKSVSFELFFEGRRYRKVEVRFLLGRNFGQIIRRLALWRWESFCSFRCFYQSHITPPCVGVFLNYRQLIVWVYPLFDWV